jgi:hypothetical protein
VGHQQRLFSPPSHSSRHHAGCSACLRGGGETGNRSREWSRWRRWYKSRDGFARVGQAARARNTAGMFVERRSGIQMLILNLLPDNPTSLPCGLPCWCSMHHALVSGIRQSDAR